MTDPADEERVPDRVHDRKIHNALTPFCRLPDEIIVDIIKTVQELQPRIWVNVTLSCSHLRNIALRTPALWSCLYLDWPRSLTDLYLERARSCLLDLRSPEPWPEHGQDIELLSQLLYRCVNGRLFMEEGMAAALEVPALVLRSLKITTRMSVFSPTSWTLTSRFLGGLCTSLFSLEVSSAQLESFPDLPNLRSLYLSQFALDPNPDCIVSLLTRTPRLVELYMIYNKHTELGYWEEMPDIYPTKPEWPAHIALLRLGSLYISAPTQVVWSVLQLAIPSKRLTVEIHRHNDTDEPSLALVLMLSDIFTSIQHFWSRATDQKNLPALVLQSEHGRDVCAPPHDNIFTMDGHGRAPHRTRVLSLWMNCSKEVFPTEPFLPFVTDVKIYVELGDLLLSPRDWPIVDRLQALKRICVITSYPKRNVWALQAWADRHKRKRRQPVIVEIMAHERAKRKDRVVWNPEDGRLKNVDWSPMRKYDTD